MEDGVTRSVRRPPANPTHVAIAYYERSEDQQCELALSSNGGRTWTSELVVGQGGQIPIATGLSTCVSPKIAFGPHNVLYYVYQANRTIQSQPREVFITVSHDDGRKFGPPVLLDDNTDRIIHQQVAIAVDHRTGRVYVAWSHVESLNAKGSVAARDVVVASSTNGGASFSPRVTPVPASQLPNFTDEPWLALGPTGTLYVSWRLFVLTPTALFGEVTTIYEARSMDHGRAFSSANYVMNVDPECNKCLRTAAYSADNRSHDMALGAKPGTIYAVGWELAGPSPSMTSNRRIIFSVSHNGGRHWSLAKVIGIPRGHSGDDQARPSITVTPAGRIIVAFQDIGTDPATAVMNIYDTYSDNGGKTWSTPRSLNTIPSSTLIGPSSFATFGGLPTKDLGPHEEIASTSTNVLYAWTDTRRGSALTGKQDVYFSSLPTPSTLPSAKKKRSHRRHK